VARGAHAISAAFAENAFDLVIQGRLHHGHSDRHFNLSRKSACEHKIHYRHQHSFDLIWHCSVATSSLNAARESCRAFSLLILIQLYSSSSK
jgi:hypothetical protein